MSPAQEQLHARLRAMDIGQRDVLLFMLCGSQPAIVAAALDRFTEIPPTSHGENHIGNAGNVVSACAPGECITCHGTVTSDGIFHPAVA